MDDNLVKLGSLEVGELFCFELDRQANWSVLESRPGLVKCEFVRKAGMAPLRLVVDYKPEEMVLPTLDRSLASQSEVDS
jgi:hypothetical protein